MKRPLRRAIALAFISVVLLGACGFTPQGNFVRGAIGQYGAQAMDEGLRNAEWFLCDAASVGSIKRRYGRSKEAAEAWKELCEGDSEVEIIGAQVP